MLAVVAWATGHAMQHSRAEWPDNKLREQRPIGAALQPAVENSIELLNSGSQFMTYRTR